VADTQLAQFLYDALAAGTEGVATAAETLGTTCTEAEVEVVAGLAWRETGGLLAILVRGSYKSGEAMVRVRAVFPHPTPQPPGEIAPTAPTPDAQPTDPTAEPLTRAEVRELQEILVQSHYAGRAPGVRGIWNSRWQRLAARVFPEPIPDGWPVRGMLETAKKWRL